MMTYSNDVTRYVFEVEVLELIVMHELVEKKVCLNDIQLIDEVDDEDVDVVHERDDDIEIGDVQIDNNEYVQV